VLTVNEQLECALQTDRQTDDGRTTAYIEREREFTFVNVHIR